MRCVKVFWDMSILGSVCASSKAVLAPSDIHFIIELFRIFHENGRVSGLGVCTSKQL